MLSGDQGVLPKNSEKGMCCWMRLQFHNWLTIVGLHFQESFECRALAEFSFEGSDGK